jgi:hypothetical protein
VQPTLARHLEEEHMHRAIQIAVTLATLIATATTASAYRIEKAEATSSTKGKHYVYSCICDNGNRVIAYSTSPIKNDDCLTACYHAGSGKTKQQMSPMKTTPALSGNKLK